MQDEKKKYEYKTEDGTYVVDCCDWRGAIEISADTPLLVIIDHKIFKLLDDSLRFDQFYTFTMLNKYKPAMLEGNLLGVCLPCPRCNGDGKTDWVEKAMKRTSNRTPESYKRDPYSKVLMFEVPLEVTPHIPKLQRDYADSFFMMDTVKAYKKKGVTHQIYYTSYPHLIWQEEYCPTCYGNGLRAISCDGVKMIGSYKE